ncbi:hypothetical protein ABZ958_30935 [Streptomyces sp. NPDC046237]|uniref:hypothetical protein n=1 Tax=Streptomyces sp. NPDC046237 TaxID=3154914 RepID=UPI0033C294BF
MDREPGSSRGEQDVDWLDTSPDLPHLFARLSELVHLHGYAPEDLVVIPRAEVDRRETAAFTAGWIEAVSEELPRIRREYEKRVADAYAQGQQDARGIRRPQRRADDGADGARVIALPFARLLEPPAVVVQAEERVRKERERFDRRPGQEPEQNRPGREPEQNRPGQEPEQNPDVEHATAPQSDEDHRPHAEEPAPEPDAPPSAQEIRTRRAAQPVRKVVRGKGGRPIVPPLANVPGQSGSGSERRGPDAGESDTRVRKGRRLSERARALEGELAERAQEAPPEPTP